MNLVIYCSMNPRPRRGNDRRLLLVVVEMMLCFACGVTHQGEAPVRQADIRSEVYLSIYSWIEMLRWAISFESFPGSLDTAVTTLQDEK